MKHRGIFNVLWIVGASILIVSEADAGPELVPSSPLVKVSRSAVPLEVSGAVLVIEGARGEVASGQAVLHHDRVADRARVSVTDLKHSNGTMIPADEVKLQWVRYIDIAENTRRFGGIPPENRAADAPTAIADPFWEGDTISVPYGPVPLRNADAAVFCRAQPVWIEVIVPTGIPAGNYRGVLRVDADDDRCELPLVVHVWDFDLPAERHVGQFNFWRFPGSAFDIEPYGDRYWELLDQHCQFLAAHRHTNLCYNNINIVEERGDERSGYTHDTGRLERFAEIAFSAGIERIHLTEFARMVGNHLEQEHDVVPVETNVRRLAAVEAMIQRRGWQGRFWLNSKDEPLIADEATYPEIIKLANRTAPSVVTFEPCHAEYLGNLDVYCPPLGFLDHMWDRFSELKREGRQVWYYTCCEPIGGYPNNFLDMTLLNSRLLVWYAWRYGLDGFACYGLNRWRAPEPYTIEFIGVDPAGDTAMTYPGESGLVGSIRLSAQRDGVQDFEYLWVLTDRYRKLIERMSEQEGELFWLDQEQRAMELCRRVVNAFTDYTHDPTVLLDTRRVIAQEIEALAIDRPVVVQTSPPEGTVLHGEPRCIVVRGLVPPDARVYLTTNPLPDHASGLVDRPDLERVERIAPNGYFAVRYCLADGEPEIRVIVEHGEEVTTVIRRFLLED
jgi:hypothetical protein